VKVSVNLKMSKNAAEDLFVKPRGGKKTISLKIDIQMGMIALNGAIHIPETAAQAANYAKPGTGTGLLDALFDIHRERPNSYTRIAPNAWLRI
jgi:hypothetical protein